MSKHSRSKTVLACNSGHSVGVGHCRTGDRGRNLPPDLDSCGFAGNAAFIRIPYRQSASAGNILSSTNDDS